MRQVPGVAKEHKQLQAVEMLGHVRGNCSALQVILLVDIKVQASWQGAKLHLLQLDAPLDKLLNARANSVCFLPFVLFCPAACAAGSDHRAHLHIKRTWRCCCRHTGLDHSPGPVAGEAPG